MESFSFSCENVKNISEIPEGEFTFFAGGEEICKVRNIIASFFSDTARKIVKEERKNSMNLSNSSYKGLLDKIVAAASGKSVSFGCEEFELLYSLAKEISSQELIDFASKFIEVNDANVYEALENGSEKAISFAASKFFDLDTKRLSTLSTETFKKVLANENFQKKATDELFAFLYEIHSFSNNFELFSLFNIDELTDSCFSFLLKEIGLENLPKSDYEKIVKRMLNFLPEPKIPVREVKYDDSQFKDCEGNLIQELEKQKIPISATSSTFIHKNMVANNIFIPSMKKLFNSKDAPNQFVVVDFGTTVRVERYDIKCGKDWGYTPMNWQVELSNDNENFSVVDIRKNCDIKEKHDAYKLKGKNYGRYMKILQTGLNSHDGNELIIGVLEVYGGYLPLSQ